MSFAPHTLDLSALDSQGRIRHLNDVFLGNRRPEAWPARSGIELGLRVEQRRAAADTTKYALAVLVQADARVRHIRVRLSGDLEGVLAQLLSPLSICLYDFCDRLFAEAFSVVAEVDDGDFTGGAMDFRARLYAGSLSHRKHGER